MIDIKRYRQWTLEDAFAATASDDESLIAAGVEKIQSYYRPAGMDEHRSLSRKHPNRRRGNTIGEEIENFWSTLTLKKREAIWAAYLRDSDVRIRDLELGRGRAGRVYVILNPTSERGEPNMKVVFTHTPNRIRGRGQGAYKTSLEMLFWRTALKDRSCEVAQAVLTVDKRSQKTQYVLNGKPEEKRQLGMLMAEFDVRTFRDVITILGSQFMMSNKARFLENVSQVNTLLPNPSRSEFIQELHNPDWSRYGSQIKEYSKKAGKAATKAAKATAHYGQKAATFATHKAKIGTLSTKIALEQRYLERLKQCGRDLGVSQSQVESSVAYGAAQQRIAGYNDQLEGVNMAYSTKSNPSPRKKALRAKYRKKYGNDWWQDDDIKADYDAEKRGK